MERYKMTLLDLPSKYADLAIKEIRKQDNIIDWNANLEDRANFHWIESSQGYDFWLKIYNKRYHKIKKKIDNFSII
jgi:hypothetical protein